MRVSDLKNLGLIWFNSVYSQKDYDGETVEKYLHSINYTIAQASLNDISIKNGRWKNNWREPMVYFNGYAYSYSLYAKKLRGCPVNWLSDFLENKRDINTIGSSLYIYRGLLQSLCVLVCFAEVGRGMFLSPDELACLLKEYGSWEIAFKNFTPALPSRLDDRSDWSPFFNFS